MSLRPGERDARAIALRVLAGVEGGGRSDRLLDRELRRTGSEDRDRRLATEIVYGVLRNQAALDRALGGFADRPLGRLDDRVLVGLRIGAYQAAFLDSIPPHAAVGATVEAVKASGSRGHGLVNGVLRAWLRQGGVVPEPRDDAERWQVPQWLAERWVARYGRDRAGLWLAATRTLPVGALAVHGSPDRADEIAASLSAAGVSVERSPWHPRALRVLEGNVPVTDAFARGQVTPRSEASQLVTALLGSGPGAALDACAGRGGKSIQLLEEGAGSAVVALDTHRGRLRDARAAARRIRIAGLHVAVADAAAPLPLRHRFERILVDAPCSGLGTIRRHPEIRWRVRPRRLAELAQTQRRILASALDRLAAGGRLLYVTCSTEPEENEQVVAAVLAQVPGARALPLAASGPAAALVGDDGFLRTYPSEPDLDGFFAALLTRS